MADESAEGSDDSSGDSIVWESVDDGDESDSEDQAVGETEVLDPASADDAREEAGTDGGTEDDEIDLEALIAEDPEGDAESGDDSSSGLDSESGESGASGRPSAGGGDETADTGSAGDRSPDDEARSEPSGEARTGGPGGESGRLWNRYGDDSPAEESGRSGESTRDPGESAPAQQGPGETATGDAGADTDDSDRLWNRQGRSGGRESGATGSATGGEDRSGSTDTAGGEASGGGSFDHLLERSGGGGGSGNTRPVGSPSVQTDLEAFFDDLDEFDRATSGSQVLVISPRDHRITDKVCSQFLTAGDVSRRNVLYVTTKQSASERIQICQGNDEWVGGKVGVVEMGDVSPSDDLGSIRGEEVVHKRVSSAKNLSKAGLLITQTLKKWSNSDQPSILCFHTLTGVSGYVQNETLFQFLFTLQAKLNSFGVTGHYHMDANRHDQQEVNTLKTLFDLVVTVSADGDIEVE